MTKDELITKQQLRIEELKKEIKESFELVHDIYNSLFCVGAPLNDNYIGLDKEQLTYLVTYIGNPIISLYNRLYPYTEGEL